MPQTAAVPRHGRCARLAAGALALVALFGLTACSGGSGPQSISVFQVQPGDCFSAPTAVKVQLSTLSRVSCDKPHTEEAYAVVKYSAGSGSSAASAPSALPSFGSSYPGNDVLTTFAQGACAERFRSYVGVDYLDSSLYFTYLLPSARSWEQADDRNVICFITTTGGTLTQSVKGSKR